MRGRFRRWPRWHVRAQDKHTPVLLVKPHVTHDKICCRTNWEPVALNVHTFRDNAAQQRHDSVKTGGEGTKERGSYATKTTGNLTLAEVGGGVLRFFDFGVGLWHGVFGFGGVCSRRLRRVHLRFLPDQRQQPDAFGPARPFTTRIKRVQSHGCPSSDKHAPVRIQTALHLRLSAGLRIGALEKVVPPLSTRLDVEGTIPSLLCVG